jgi:TusA-related sulfurtransferase
MGSRCPQPIIDIARYMRDKPIGTEAILLSDDPATAPDISAWARMTKNFSQEIARHRFLIRKESNS